MFDLNPMSNYKYMSNPSPMCSTPRTYKSSLSLTFNPNDIPDLSLMSNSTYMSDLSLMTNVEPQ